MAVQGSQDKGEPRSELGPLPGGHHGLSPEQVAESQRERLLAAVVHTTAERGYRATTITEIVRTASVSTRVFYELFASKEECFLDALDAILAHLRELITTAAEPAPDWPHRVIAALRSVLDFFAAEPDLARFCMLESLTATPTIAIRFREEVRAAIPLLAAGRNGHPAAAELPASTEDALVGGLIVLTSNSVLAGTRSLPALLPDLVEFVLSPYLGSEVASALAAEASVAPSK